MDATMRSLLYANVLKQRVSKVVHNLLVFADYAKSSVQK